MSVSLKSSSSLFKTPAGAFKLQRYPVGKEESLRAWNAADSLLVEHLYSYSFETRTILTVNDDQGALSVALSPRAIWTDSELSRIGIQKNLERNGCDATPIVDSTVFPMGNFSAVAIKVPKLSAFFEHQLALLADAIRPGTPVVAAGMDKHLSPHTAAMLEKYIGPTQRHRGQMKARLFTAIRDERPARAPATDVSYYCVALEGKLMAMANVFSREKLDVGSHFLIEQMHQLAPAEHAIDLACGNGVLGLVAMHNGLCKSLAFCDESAMAVESARRNAAALMPDAMPNLRFEQADGLLHYDGPRADLILCNPPFHSNHAVQESVGKRLLSQCAKHLQGSGTLCVIANRHLPYRATLTRGFSRVEKLAQNNKFVIWLAQN